MPWLLPDAILRLKQAAGRLFPRVSMLIGRSPLARYAQDVETVTLDQVNRTLRKYLRPSRFVTVLAGTVPGVVASGHNRHPLRRPD
jgi:hypothetical protein